ncbi:TolB family protein [Herpetosiphon geysericola]|uniref:TolB family protein n=1 Tax=Herpetosiphon geysericola TaxID=70996 RepID=UPI0006C938EB|nr:DPP IV N-terminal domain-containing protein [Herpetosiphon geysericola]
MNKNLRNVPKGAIITGIATIIAAIITAIIGITPFINIDKSSINFLVRVINRSNGNTVDNAKIIIISKGKSVSGITDNNGISDFSLDFISNGDIMEINVIYENIEIVRENAVIVNNQTYDIQIDVPDSNNIDRESKSDKFEVLPTEISIISTDIPPTDIPPTDIPPTDIPPTDIPPTDIPPTDIPPTDIPPKIPSIVFVSNRDGNDDIYLTDEHETFSMNLTNSPNDIYNGHPSWSPDGKNIVFHSNMDDPGGHNSEIYIISVEGNNLRRLTNHLEWDGQPSWSPDGRYIAFESKRDGKFEIFLYDLNNDTINKINTNMSAGYPSWSPNGKYIAFHSKDFSGMNIYMINMENNIITPITMDEFDNWMPSWSKNSENIIFSSNKDGVRDIYSLNLVDKNIKKVIPTNEDDWWPVTLSPDGTKIIFCSYNSGFWKLYIANIDGSNIRVFAESNGDTKWAVWKN